MEIVSKVKILNQLGLHLRAAVQLVTASSKFKCRILIRNRHRQADCKSILNLIALAASYGTEVTLTFKGEDAQNAQAVIQNLFLTRFGGKGISAWGEWHYERLFILT